ncbi:TRIC cation channel family protein [Iamia majanohamensis]|uniref:TRIC cation channel family protein n=1 Tax=Iamia majanohamensis TaxID=467976 RepID=A0AAE9YA37_9ACTN|nr:TRIC cation channel family protein [Iamia majanohamensis]WCO68626.1 TRIC cation channel family protein [Iamia majanohamensis]
MGVLETSGDTVILVMEVVGTVAFALSGVMAGARARLDWLGVVVLAVVVSVGGGTLRDLILDVPIDWLTESWPLLLAAAVAVVAIPVVERVGGDLDSRAHVLVADAAGLAAFAVVGADVALDQGVAAWAAAVLGVVTGVGGGVIRDLLVRRRPAVLSGQIYALAALAGTSLYVLLLEVDVEPLVATWLGVLTILAVRLAAIHWDWSLPVLRAPGGDEDED